jgi:hypothetical protein
VLQILKDNKATLQALSSSKYVVHFPKAIRELEITLSQIGDLTSVWLQVQLKWMYLESIFIGSEDIQQHTIKLFDNCEHHFFCKVCIHESFSINKSANPRHQHPIRSQYKIEILSDIMT